MRNPILAGLVIVAAVLCCITTASALCGNGVVETGESCDDGNLADGDGCSSSCRITSVCGNGVIEWGEACDDGNLADGDGCPSTCGKNISIPEFPSRLLPGVLMAGLIGILLYTRRIL